MLEKLNSIKLFLARHLKRDSQLYALLRKIYKKFFVWQARWFIKHPQKFANALKKYGITNVSQSNNSSGFTIELHNKKLWWKNPTDPNHLLSIIIFSHQGVFEPVETNLFTKLIGSRDVIIDIGANFGWHSLTFAKLAHEGRIICFEPDEKTFQELQANINLNYPSPQKHIYLEKYALGNEKREVLLYLPQKLGAAFASVMPDYYEGISGKVAVEKIQMIRLDDYLQEKNINHVDFIKCDVEGAPHLVVEGAKKLLSQKEAPLLFVEITKRNPDEFNTFRLLGDLGYQAFVFHNDKLHLVNPEKIGAEMTDYNFLFAKDFHSEKISPLIK